jgi:hypothetical protein
LFVSTRNGRGFAATPDRASFDPDAHDRQPLDELQLTKVGIAFADAVG